MVRSMRFLLSVLVIPLAACRPEAVRPVVDLDQRVNAVVDCVNAKTAPADYRIPACTYAPPSTGFLPKNEAYGVVWLQRATESDAVIDSVYRGALAQLDAALSRPDSALARSEARAAGGLPNAVIVDIDETILDNDEFNARTLANRIAFSEAAFECWGEDRRAKAYPAAREFLNAASERGAQVFYITNRRENQRGPVVDTLRKQGFPVRADGGNVIFRGFDSGDKDGSKEKGARRACVAQQFKVAMMFGDNLGDFLDQVEIAADQRNALALREGADQWWGRAWFMLPNPAYGSWPSGTQKFRADGGTPDQNRNANMETWVDPGLPAAGDNVLEQSFESH